MAEHDVADRPAAATDPARPAPSRAVAMREPDMKWLDIPREELVPTLINSLYPGAKIESVNAVLDYCTAAGLNVMLKPVHIVPMSVKEGTQYRMRDVIMPGINHYRTQASRTNTYLGKSEPEWGPAIEKSFGDYKISVPEWCRITVRRLVAGHVAEFTAEEYWDENYATKGRDTTTPNAMWQKRPKGQLHKCTEAQALRMAFPELVGAETAEEMEGKTIDLTPEEAVRPSAAVRSLDQFAGANEEPEPGPEDAVIEEIVEVDETPGMPDEAWKPFYEPTGKAKPDWKPGWRWLNETLEGETHYTGGVKQELAERYCDLLWSVHASGGKQQAAVVAFVEKHGMIVPDPAKPAAESEASDAEAK
jgi:phage recombination protein Bet